MRRIAGVLGALAVVLVVGVGVAVAASSPTVSTGNATTIKNTSATVNGKVNPNGSSTSYDFQYGLTSSYGHSSTAHVVGSGTTAKAVSAKITGLIPGTVYHYHISARNKSGVSVGSDRKFKTTGHPPAAVITGPPSSVRKTMATVTGSINPEGAPTNWVFQYGLTPAYGTQTTVQTIPAGTSPVPVSVTLTGLAPATGFHYRLVAYHGLLATAGNDATFFTEPDHRPASKVRARTRPGVARNAPYRFTTSGIVRGGSYIPASSRCTGNVGVRYYKGKHQVAFALVAVSPNCRFVARKTVARHFIHGPTALRIVIHFRGNGYLTPGNRTDHVTAG